MRDLLLPSHEVAQIRYFTALVSERAGKPGTEIRQQKYVQAIQTDPRVSVHLGHYLTSTRTARNAHLPPSSVRYVHVEEKGSDVNLASYLLLDAFERRYEMGVVISNDSDLVEPIRLVGKSSRSRSGSSSLTGDQTSRCDKSHPG